MCILCLVDVQRAPVWILDAVLRLVTAHRFISSDVVLGCNYMCCVVVGAEDIIA